MGESDGDSDFKFSNLRQRFEDGNKNGILRPSPPRTAPKPKIVLIRNESMRTPTDLLERRRAVEVEKYRKTVTSIISDNSDTDDESSHFAANSASYNLNQLK